MDCQRRRFQHFFPVCLLEAALTFSALRFANEMNKSRQYERKSKIGIQNEMEKTKNVERTEKRELLAKWIE